METVSMNDEIKRKIKSTSGHVYDTLLSDQLPSIASLVMNKIRNELSGHLRFKIDKISFPIYYQIYYETN